MWTVGARVLFAIRGDRLSIYLATGRENPGDPLRGSLFLAEPGALHDRTGSGSGPARRAQGDRIAADFHRPLSGALADCSLVGELPARRHVERLVGRAAVGDAEPGADRGAGPAAAAEHGDWRDRRRLGVTGRYD